MFSTYEWRERESRLFDSLDDQLMHSVAQQSTVLGSSVALAAHSLNSPESWSHTRAHSRRSQFNSVAVHFGQRDSKEESEQREFERGVANVTTWRVGKIVSLHFLLTVSGGKDEWKRERDRWRKLRVVRTRLFNTSNAWQRRDSTRNAIDSRLDSTLARERKSRTSWNTRCRDREPRRRIGH